MQDFSDDIAALRKRLSEAHGYLGIDDLIVRQPELAELAAQPDLWDDQDEARKITGELSSGTDDIELYNRLDEEIQDTETLAELAAEEDDESLVEEIVSSVGAIAEKFEALELRALFQGEFDERDAVCKVQAGEGGTDSQDWAEMLIRMYMKWAERRGFELEVVAAQDGGEAGISSAEFMVKGRHAFGLAICGSTRTGPRALEVSTST